QPGIRSDNEKAERHEREAHYIQQLAEVQAQRFDGDEDDASCQGEADDADESVEILYRYGEQGLQVAKGAIRVIAFLQNDGAVQVVKQSERHALNQKRAEELERSAFR